MREQYLKSITSALSDAFLKIRFQPMISFTLEGIYYYSFHYMNRVEHLHSWLKNIETEDIPHGLKYPFFIKSFLNLGNAKTIRIRHHAGVKVRKMTKRPYTWIR